MVKLRFMQGYVAKVPENLDNPKNLLFMKEELERVFELGRMAGKAEFKAEFKKLFSIY